MWTPKTCEVFIIQKRYAFKESLDKVIVSETDMGLGGCYSFEKQWVGGIEPYWINSKPISALSHISQKITYN